MNRLIVLVVIIITFSNALQAQSVLSQKNYVGIAPSFLVEPYDTINAIEVNVLPIVYERRFGNNMGFQFRTMMNYRFFKPAPGISQIGGTVVVNKYITSWFKEDFWLNPVFGGFFTYTYNNLDFIHTLIAGAEVGALFSFSEHFSVATTVQPGINYYPDQYSRDFVETESGFKGHFGVIVQLGYSF